MEDAKNSTMVLNMLGFLAMLPAISLPPGFVPKWRCGELVLGERSAAVVCWRMQGWSSLFPTFFLPLYILAEDLHVRKKDALKS